MNELFQVALEEMGRTAISHPLSSGMDQETVSAGIRRLMRALLGLVFLSLAVCSLILLFDAPPAGGLSPKLIVSAYLIVNIFSLFLLVRFTAGNFRLLPYSTIVLLMLGLGILFSYFSERHLEDPFLLAFVIAVIAPLIALLLIGMVTERDPMPATSPFLRLAYPGRFAHLNALDRFAVSRGWEMRGPVGYYHALEINGLWNGRQVSITDGHQKFKSRGFPTHNFIAVKMIFETEFLPWGVAGRRPGVENPEEVFQGTFGVGKNEKTMWLVLNQADPGKSRASAQAMLRELSSVGGLAGKTTEFWTDSRILEYRSGSVRLFEGEEYISDLLGSMEKLGGTLQVNGLTVEDEA